MTSDTAFYRTLRATTLGLGLAFSSGPALAQDAGDDDNMVSEGLRLFFRGILDDVEPHMRDMADALEGWDLDGLDIDDLDNYQSPEVLPDGDIIIRRRDDAPPYRPELPRDPDTEVEL
ncbi:AAA+ family ATPase [Mesobaculum littorinae]|uniref:AAA+ family ATPase n=1 Tax=Mesobaculum littorinae TaxID=2486419 RepID=UPI0019D47CBB|nr:AAA+ family ATPase [Mesobaculum littorinae]